MKQKIKWDKGPFKEWDIPETNQILHLWQTCIWNLVSIYLTMGVREAEVILQMKLECCLNTTTQDKNQAQSAVLKKMTGFCLSASHKYWKRTAQWNQEDILISGYQLWTFLLLRMLVGIFIYF